jgi:hypothetical protein
MVTGTKVVKLHRMLTKCYRGTRTDSRSAAAKRHLEMSVMGKEVDRVKLTDERFGSLACKALTAAPIGSARVRGCVADQSHLPVTRQVAARVRRHIE